MYGMCGGATYGNLPVAHTRAALVPRYADALCQIASFPSSVSHPNILANAPSAIATNSSAKAECFGWSTFAGSTSLGVRGSDSSKNNTLGVPVRAEKSPAHARCVRVLLMRQWCGSSVE